MHGYAAPARAGVLAVAGLLACGGIDPQGPSTTYTTLSSDTDEACDPSTTGAGDESAGDTGPCSTTDMCTPGIEGCPCTRGGACDPGLSCISEVCVDASCAVGSLGCPCTQGGGCDPELACVDDVCTAS